MYTPHTPEGKKSPGHADLTGATIAGKYQVKRLLGHGGMGSVYKAENLAIGRTVAIKLLHHHLADDGVTLTRFQREARATASVGHAHVVEILDMGIEPSGVPFIVMEYVRGKALAKLLEAEGALPPARAASIAGQILDALAALHETGVVHRDLKPENVLLTTRHGRSDYVKIFDFGVATYMEGVHDAIHAQELTPSGRSMGTPYYSSPEQLEGSGGRDPRVDLYAVGVLLYEMLTGHRPFASKRFPDLVRDILEGEVAPMRVHVREVPEGLEAIVRRALARSPEARWSDARAMQAALVPFGGPEPEEEPEPTDTFTHDLRELALREEMLLRAGGATPPADEAGIPLEVVRGEIPLAMLGFLRERVGEAHVQRVLERLSPESRGVLAGEILPSGWYPDAMLDALEVADQIAGEGDRKLIADAGRHFARTIFGSSRELAARSITPELVFSMSSDIWRRYFAQGEVRVVKLGRGYGRVEVHGQTRPRLSRSVAIVGYLSEALRMAGAREPDVRLTRAAALGDSFDVLEAAWSS